MAKIELNESLGTIRGKIDGWVYRNLHGQVVAHAYRAPKPAGPSVRQAGARDRFRAAQAYAAEVMAHPLRRAVYLKLGAVRKCPVNALLVSNFLTPPSIDTIVLTRDTADDIGTIEIVATDPVEVTAVTVRVLDDEGHAIEAGAATKDNGIWIYRLTKAGGEAKPEGAGSKTVGGEWSIEVTARNPAQATATRTERLSLAQTATS